MRQLENISLPDELYALVEETARERQRSVAEQAAEFVAIGLAANKGTIAISKAEKLSLADRVRGQTQGTWLTDEFIRRARDEGRA